MFNFIYKNIHLLFFGFLIAFTSGFGQTFFISLFSDDFRSTFDLTNTEFGSLYSIATVLSAITIIWAGKLIDTVSLEKFDTSIKFINGFVAELKVSSEPVRSVVRAQSLRGSGRVV